MKGLSPDFQSLLKISLFLLLSNIYQASTSHSSVFSLADLHVREDMPSASIMVHRPGPSLIIIYKLIIGFLLSAGPV